MKKLDDKAETVKVNITVPATLRDQYRAAVKYNVSKAIRSHMEDVVENAKPRKRASAERA